MSRRTLVLILVMASLLAQGCAAHKKGMDLGGGFTRVTEEVKGASGTEGISHVDHLYYKGADLGVVGFVSVAPSGSHAIFERDGGLFLMASTNGNLKPVTDGKFSKPKQVNWNEAEGFALVEYSDDHPSSRINLRGNRAARE